MNLSADCFVKNFFDPILYLLCKDSKRNWVFTLLSSEMHGLSIGQGLTGRFTFELIHNTKKQIFCTKEQRNIR